MDTRVDENLSKHLLIEGLIQYYKGIIAKHKANISIYMTKSIGIGEHSDIVETIDKELDSMATAQDKLDVLQKQFIDNG